MPKMLSAEELNGLKAGETGESSPRNHPAGLYVHKETGVELFVRETPKFGNVQADAAIRVGYEFVRPATVEEMTGIGFAPEKPKNNTSAAPAMANDTQATLDELRDLLKTQQEKISALESAAPKTEKKVELMNKTELLAKCGELGIVLEGDKTNAQLIALINGVTK